MMPAAPVSGAMFHGVWTGSVLIVHRPDYQRGKGSVTAAYDPATHRWQKLASSPYTVQSNEAGSQVVWTGTEMLTFGVQNAGYNPATGKWRALTAPPVAAPSIVVWTGRLVLQWGGGCCDEASDAGAAYDPATDRWQALPGSPLDGRRTSGTWTGTEMIVVGGQAHGETFFADAAAYNPVTGVWRMLAPLPAPRYDATVTWTGTQLLVVGGQPASPSTVPYDDGYCFDPSANQWRQMASMGLARTDHMAAWTGTYLLVWGGQTKTANGADFSTPPHGVAYDPASDRWQALPKAPLKGRMGAVTAWTGTELLVWGGLGAVSPFPTLLDGAVYTPDVARSQL